MAEKEEEMAEPQVRLLKSVRSGEKRRRLGSEMDEKVLVKEEEVLIDPLGPRDECGGLLRRVGVESVFRETSPGYVARSNFTPAAVGVSRQSEARRQGPEVSGGYQLRPGVGCYRGQGWEG